MNNRTIKLLAVALFVPTLAQARQISGLVLSENDSTAIVGAVCELKSDAATAIKAAGDVNGAFTINTSDRKAATLSVSAVGYGQAEIVIRDGGHDIKDLKIYLPDIKTLEAVTVTAAAATMRNGRTIVYPSAQEASASASSVELFQKLPLPGLTADPINRLLSVDGGSPMILIDGVPSAMSDINALKAKDIERVEYSRITPARYADKGYKGLLQITLKHRNDGGSIELWARSATATAFVDDYVNATYHQGPSQFKLYFYNSWRNYQRVYDNTTQSYVGDDFRVDLESHDRNPFNYVINQLQLGYTYRPDSKTLFSAKLSGGINPSGRRYIADTKDSYAGDYESTSKSASKYTTPSLDLFFKKDFDDANSLEVQAVGTLRFEDYNRTNTYYIDPANPQVYDVEIDNTRRSLITEIAYRHRFGNASELGAGFQNTLSHSRNKYIGTDYRPILTENNNYGYVNYGFTIDKFNFWLASGVKIFRMENGENKRDFVRNLSNVNINWDISNEWSLQANFNYSPSIPGLSALTDYKQQTTPYLIDNGNPNLKVAEYFNYRLMASFSHKKFFASLTAYYSNANNPRTDEYFYLGDKKFLSQTVNYTTNEGAGASLQMKLSGIAGFGGNVRLDVDWTHTQGTTWNKNLTTFYAYGSFWWSRGPWTITYWRKIPCKNLHGPYIGKEENGDGLSVTFRPDKHWMIQAGWWYMFARGTEYPQWNISTTAPAYTDRYIKDNANMVVVTASYTADFGSIFRSGRRSLNNADNSSSILQL